MNDILLDIRDLEVSYDTEDGIVRAVNGIDLQVRRGKTLGIVGETGAGKTTTAKASCVCCRNVPVISDRAVLPSMVRTFLHCQWMICSPVFAARKSR